ncbi:MAG TPA: transketolase C-terminal domain-containing protein [Thermoanaerobaculia bacterium]|nr:transketolase C-terminal domain-containing protein [Thermoanaerobaculia bacterium]
MRTAFLDTLYELAKADRRIVFVTGDLGFSVVERFMADLPDQFVNAGVAEQNMTSLAAGMALMGKIAFTYSIANFPTLRCLEQVRNDVCYHEANVKIVAVGGGFTYGAMGASHHATEELGVMRMMPGMVVVAPADPVEARAATRAIVAHRGPCYIRLGKAGEPNVHQGAIDFQLGRAIQLRGGRDLTLISTGGMLGTALAVADRLAGRGVEASVLSMHTLKPLDEEAVRAAARETGGIVTLEQHSVIGGLGSAVAEVLAELPAGNGARGTGVPFRRIGVPSAFSARVGSQKWLEQQHGLDEEGVLAQVEELLA